VSPVPAAKPLNNGLSNWILTVSACAIVNPTTAANATTIFLILVIMVSQYQFKDTNNKAKVRPDC
jgi:hypothetical protein